MHNHISEKIIGCAFDISGELGCGFLEKVYENARVVALRQSGLEVSQQVESQVFFRGVNVGKYIADLVVERCFLLELKANKGLDDVHLAQCINAVYASQLPGGLLINFGKPRVESKRVFGRDQRQQSSATVDAEELNSTA